MTRDLIVVNDFLSNPLAVRERALQQDFDTEEYQGHSYSGIGRSEFFKPWVSLRRALGTKRGIKPLLSFFRSGRSTDSSTAWIHSDASVPEATWACVLYLSDPSNTHKNGTAMWRHRSLGWDYMPSPEEILAQGLDPSDQDFVDQMNEDANVMERWEMTDYVDGKFNRLLIYPSNRFHSRWPKQGWGESVEEGRLIWCAFFTEE